MPNLMRKAQFTSLWNALSTLLTSCARREAGTTRASVWAMRFVTAELFDRTWASKARYSIVGFTQCLAVS